jgi:hypothetical protein
MGKSGRFDVPHIYIHISVDQWELLWTGETAQRKNGATLMLLAGNGTLRMHARVPMTTHNRASVGTTIQEYLTHDSYANSSIMTLIAPLTGTPSRPTAERGHVVIAQIL